MALPSDRKPKKAQDGHSAALKSVIENGLEFIERAVRQLWSPGDPNHLKHSVISFYSGVELLLKARLMADHWALIVSDINKADRDAFRTGDFRSVGLDETVSRLAKISGEDIPAGAIDAFTNLRKHRNRMVHFFHKGQDETKEKDEIIREQCRSWFHLRRLIGDKWGKQFLPYKTKVRDINSEMKRHRNYLHTVYIEITPELKKEEGEGALLGHCISCGYSSHVIDEVGPFESQCRVCRNLYTFVRYTCKSCGNDFLLNDGEDEHTCPNCGEKATTSQVADSFAVEGRMSEKDFHTEGGYGHCVECTGMGTVGTIGEQFFCFRCFQWHQSMGRCDWCGDLSTGDLSDSYWRGCAICEGKGWD